MSISSDTPIQFRSIRPKQTGGFLLLEVLVAVTVLAVGITAALNGIFNSIDGSRQSRDYTQALFLAQRIMSVVENQVSFMDEFDRSKNGVFEEVPNFRWQYSVEEIPDFWTRRITVSVIWSDDISDLYNEDKTNYYTLVTEVPRPRYPYQYKK